MDINYDIYAKGEAEFAWVDRVYEITFSALEQKRSIADWIVLIARKLDTGKYKIAHLKFLIINGEDNIKFNLTSQDNLEDKISTLITQLDRFKHKDLKLIFNLMVEGDSAQCDTIIDNVFQDANVNNQISIRETERFSRTPGYPKPNIRIG